ncbi:hypothetical protein AJ88_28075 [Mesorhizobium amorphae CCBAU 01583]|nr:hypothetical protein AJ88_28075 [Mesorhizobium amorphae CCBAU 01583]
MRGNNAFFDARLRCWVMARLSWIERPSSSTSTGILPSGLADIRSAGLSSVFTGTRSTAMPA